MCGSGDTRSTVLKKYKMVQGNKEKREQSWRMMNVSYAGISNITYVKQQQQDDQMRPSSMKTRIEYSLLTWLGQAKTMWTQIMQRRYKNTQQLTDRQPGYNVMIIPIVIGCLGGDMGRVTY